MTAPTLDPALDFAQWVSEVHALAEQRDAVILAHNYQVPEIQDVAHHVGDSLALSRIAATAPQSTIVFCGVHFMAETAKILSPDKTVLIPDADAGCSLADSMTADQLREWKAANPGAVVVSYVNTTAEVKAETDICCTSSNAVEVVRSIPPQTPVLFRPDQFLGAHVRRILGLDNIQVWGGECHVHAGINGGQLTAQAQAHPDADLYIHPECGCATSALYLATAGAVVVGTGVAGLTCALDAVPGLRVLVVTKGAADEANTSWAQGGVAVVRDERDPGDSVAAHVQDTLVAGAGLSDPAAVELILGAGPGAVRRLIARGATFDAGPGGLLRTREGGHTANRVIHAGGDATGAEIERSLLAAVGLPTVLADHLALDVVLDGSGRARGLAVLAPDGRVGLIRAGAVILAPGGAGHLYAATTNPGVATADGLAIALRAGAALADVEFMQFHPTVLWTGPGDLGHRALVTEAVRGEGAVLIDAAGERVMRGVHPLADLAPRDVVSLAVTRRLAGAPAGVTD